MGIVYDVNEDFFDTWSNEMAYVLGFIFADGYIGEYAYFRAKYISVSNTDRDRVELVKRLLDSSHIIRIINKGGTYKTAYVIRIGNQRLYNRLIELGVTPRKSLTMLFPDIPREYSSSFVLGYFDGDGCVSIERNKRGQVRRLLTIFTSGSEGFLLVLHDLFRELGVKGKGLIKHGSTEGAYQLRYSTRDSLRIFLYMYDSSEMINLSLQRKYAIFVEYLTMRNLTKESIPSILDLKGPVVKREHDGLQNHY